MREEGPRQRAYVRLLLCIVAVACTGIIAPGGAKVTQVEPLRSCVVAGLEVAARCGTIDVAEVHGEDGGRRIALRVVVIPSAAPAPLPDPMLFLAGGPGQGAAELAAPLAARMRSLRGTRDLILVDQRGTGASHPLKCPPPARTEDLMGRMFDEARLRTCRDQLTARADLRQYATSAAARDYEAVLNALNVRQVNVWGVSYGSRLALELVRRMPARIRTVILEAPVPTSFSWPTTGARDADAALMALVDDCEGDTACAVSYPTFRRDIDTAFRRLSKAPARAQVVDPQTRQTSVVPFTTSDLAYAVRGILYGPEALRLPRLFRAAASGQFDPLAQAYVTRARALGTEIATGVHLGVYCAEDLPFVDAAHARTLSARTRLDTYLLDQYSAACAAWPRSQIPGDFRDPVRSDIPALVMAGRRDPVTPPSSAAAIAKTLARARVLTWDAGAHGFEGLASPACKDAIVSEFVSRADPGRLPTACMSRERRLPFTRD